MANNRGRTIKLNPVDDGLVTDHPARANLEAIMDQKLFHQRIRSERSSAYWFAASLWGVTGLVIGGVLGAYMMYMAQMSSLPLASDAVMRGMAAEQARRTVDGRPGLLNDDHQNQPSQQQP